MTGGTASTTNVQRVFLNRTRTPSGLEGWAVTAVHAPRQNQAPPPGSRHFQSRSQVLEVLRQTPVRRVLVEEEARVQAEALLGCKRGWCPTALDFTRSEICRGSGKSSRNQAPRS